MHGQKSRARKRKARSLLLLILLPLLFCFLLWAIFLHNKLYFLINIGSKVSVRMGIWRPFQAASPLLLKTEPLEIRAFSGFNSETGLL